MQPNILLVFPDQLRSDWVEPRAAVPVRTPNAKALAERGVNFEQAWTPSPICAPARACIATGRRYDRSPVQHNNQNVPAGADTIYRRMADNGYETSTVGKLDLLKGFMGWGADGKHMTETGESRLADLGFTRGIDNAGKHDAIYGRERGAREPYMTYLAEIGLADTHDADFRRRDRANIPATVNEIAAGDLPLPDAYTNPDLSPLPDEAYCDNWIGRQAMKELEDLKDTGKPWFLTVNFAGPHEPLDVTARMRDRWKDVAFPEPVDGSPDPRHQMIRQNYAAMIEVIDDWLGRFLAFLDETGQRDNTLVVFASDHGEMLGDHRLWAKSVPDENSVRVPLIVAGAGVSAKDRVVRTPVSLLDMAKTFLDLSGAPDAGMEGDSLRGLLEGGDEPDDKLVFSGLGPWRTVTDGRFKLVAGDWRAIRPGKMQFTAFDPAGLDTVALFDLDEDPEEREDIAAAHPEIRERLLGAIRDDMARA